MTGRGGGGPGKCGTPVSGEGDCHLASGFVSQCWRRLPPRRHGGHGGGEVGQDGTWVRSAVCVRGCIRLHSVARRRWGRSAGVGVWGIGKTPHPCPLPRPVRRVGEGTSWAALGEGVRWLRAAWASVCGGGVARRRCGSRNARGGRWGLLGISRAAGRIFRKSCCARRVSGAQQLPKQGCFEGCGFAVAARSCRSLRLPQDDSCGPAGAPGARGAWSAFGRGGLPEGAEAVLEGFFDAEPEDDAGAEAEGGGGVAARGGVGVDAGEEVFGADQDVGG